jgi:tetratricopeptide (TPR) repeat protein
MPRRTRLTAFVVASALAAVGVAIGGAILQGDDGAPAPEAAPEGRPPPLQLDVYASGPTADALRAAESAYDEGRLQAAARRFERILVDHPGSVEAAVGAAVAAWPDDAVARLRSLAGEHEDNAVVLLHLGLALAATGETDAAREEWRAAVERDPDTPSAVRADSLLHPDMAPGLPFFLPTAEPTPRVGRLAPLEQLTALRRRAAGGPADDSLLLGSALQRLGMPISARSAFDQAVRRDPAGVEAQVAAAVGRFDKDDPSQAFSRLGPLARDHPRAAVVRFHLGLMLLWIRGVEEARRQLRQAIRAEPGSIYAREAKKLLTTLAAS